MHTLLLRYALATALLAACSSAPPAPKAAAPVPASAPRRPVEIPKPAPVPTEDLRQWEAAIACLAQEGSGCDDALLPAEGSAATGSGSGEAADGDTASFLRATMVLRDACTRQFAPACGALARQLASAGPESGNSARALELAKRGCEGHDLSSCSIVVEVARRQPAEAAAAENYLLARCNGIVPEACVALGRGYASQAIPQGDRGLMNGLFTRGCEQKVAEGCAELAISHQYGRGTPVRLAEALHQATAACEQGSVRGCISRAELLLATAAPQAFEQATALYHDACDKADPRGCAGEARLNLMGGRRTLAPSLVRALTQGCSTEPAACEQLSVWTGRQPKPSRAPLEEACRLGEPHACRFLASSWMEPSHGRTDAREAARIRSAACDRRDAEACVDLAVQRITGPGLTPDPAESRIALTALCKGDTLRACVELGLLLSRPGTSETDRDEARTVLDHACQQGAGWGCVHLGRLNRNETERALSWLDKGCALQVGWGCVEAGDLRTERVENETGRAITDYIRGCEAGTMQGCLKAAQALDRVNPGDAQARTLAALACDAALPDACALAGKGTGGAE